MCAKGSVFVDGQYLFRTWFLTIRGRYPSYCNVAGSVKPRVPLVGFHVASFSTTPPPKKKKNRGPSLLRPMAMMAESSGDCHWAACRTQSAGLGSVCPSSPLLFSTLEPRRNSWDTEQRSQSLMFPRPVFVTAAVVSKVSLNLYAAHDNGCL